MAARGRSSRSAAAGTAPAATSVRSAALLAERTKTWTNDERSTLGAVMVALNPSPRHVADILDWLDDIAARTAMPPAAVLADPHLERIRRARGSAPDRLKRWKEQLRRMRYPRLAARETALADAVQALTAGGAVTITPPPALEGSAATFAVRARSTAELAAALDRLRSAISRGDVDRLFALLDEA